MTNWQDVLEQQHALWKMFRSPRGLEYQQAFLDQLQGEASRWVYERLVETQQSVTFHAEPVAMHEDVMTVVEAAADSFAPEAWQPEDFFTPIGFMYLPRPLETYDDRDKLCSARALSWMPCQAIKAETDEPRSGFMLTLYAHRLDHSYYDDAFLAANGYPIPQFYPGCDLTVFHMMPLWWGDTWEDTHSGFFGDLTRTRSGESAMYDIWRFFQVALRIAQQRITSHDEKAPARGMRRNMKREGRASTGVTVITLRRATTPKEHAEERHVEWSCRWLVRGHWRNQWYPSTEQHRQIWISGYVKGPEEKELRVTKRAFEFAR